MIAVIADDLSGAAELANAALQEGHSAEVQLRFSADSDANVLCVDTDTRALPPQAAAARAGQVALVIAASRPSLVYKKCDSVLRGSVAEESLAIARALRKKRILLIPANPSRNRVIQHGEYFVNGIPLAQTAFATDPDYPRRSSLVAELLGDASGIETPDAVSAEDLSRLAATVDSTTLPAGAVDFFIAVLRAKNTSKAKKPAASTQPWTAPTQTTSSLYVCGSNAALLGGLEAQCARSGIQFFFMPPALFNIDFQENILANWANAVAKALYEKKPAMLVIGKEKPTEGVTSQMLAGRLAQAVALVLKTNPVSRLFVEGGATAAAVVRQLGLERFHVQPSPGVGVGALRPVVREQPLFLIKPGSYPWPDSVWPGPAS